MNPRMHIDVIPVAQEQTANRSKLIPRSCFGDYESCMFYPLENDGNANCSGSNFLVFNIIDVIAASRHKSFQVLCPRQSLQRNSH